MVQSFQGIGLLGHSVGIISFAENAIEWKDRSNAAVKEIPKAEIGGMSWAVYGGRAHLKVALTSKSGALRFDGFAATDFELISNLCKKHYSTSVVKDVICTDGAHFGKVAIEDKSMLMKSKSGSTVFDMKLDQMSLCVVPASNRDEVEIHFNEQDRADREEDSLVQITLHFPANEDPEEDTQAEEFRKSVLDTGILKADAGSVIVEFSKEQGNFVNPRGKYGLQMLATYLHMQGPQYSYKIKYDDIHSLFLLPKPDGGRMAFVISLEKPIRQGSQKYQHLILETHKVEHTISVNLTDEEIQTRYDGQLATEMTMPLSSLIAKVFKVLSQTTVYVPKHFASARNTSAVRCSLKANDGLLYPLAKSFIFINKPTVIIKFEDIDSVKFSRYDPAASSGARNFDLQVSLKYDKKTEVKEYTFSSIDRSEFSSLHDFLTTRRLNVLMDETAKKANYAESDEDEGALPLATGSNDEDSEDDEDYEGSEHSSDDDDDDDDEDDTDNSEADENSSPQGRKNRPKAKSKGQQKKRKSRGGDEDDGAPAKKSKKKDKNAPKGAKTAFIIFTSAVRSNILQENPDMSVTEVAKEAGVRWKNLSSDDKAPYEEQAREDKERYKREMAAYEGAAADNDE